MQIEGVLGAFIAEVNRSIPGSFYAEGVSIPCPGCGGLAVYRYLGAVNGGCDRAVCKGPGKCFDWTKAPQPYRRGKPMQAAQVYKRPATPPPAKGKSGMFF